MDTFTVDEGVIVFLSVRLYLQLAYECIYFLCQFNLLFSQIVIYLIRYFLIITNYYTGLENGFKLFLFRGKSLRVR